MPRQTAPEPLTLQALNRSAVLRVLRREGPVSRGRLRELTGLSNAALGAVLSDLTGQSLIVERDAPSGGIGRPPSLVSIDYSARVAVGVKVMERRLEAVLTDLGTAVQQRHGVDTADVRPETVVAATAELVHGLLVRGGVARERLVGVGLAMPGVIDSPSGLCSHVPSFGWRDVPLGRLLERALDCPVWIDNNANTFAMAQYLFGHGRRVENLAAVTIGRGIGAGFIVNGQLVRGRDGGAGELGHTVVERGGRACVCGKSGCLEAYASEPALLARLLAEEPELAEARDADVLLQAVEAGHPLALQLVTEAGERIGLALANVVNLLNPELIVLGGEGVRLGPPLLEPLRRALSESCFNGLGTGLPLVVDDWGDDGWAIGAAGLAVQRAFFSEPHLVI